MLVAGASGGIGGACVRAFAGEGARVVVHYNRGEERANALAGEIGAAATAQADLTSEADVDRLFAEARALSAGSTSASRCRASGRARTCPSGSSRSSAGRRRSGRTSRPSFLVARGFLREVERNGHGSLVLVGSTAGVFGEAGHADYAAAKSAVLGGLLLSLKNEITRIAPLGRVNAVAPGWTESPMTRGLVDPETVRAVSRTMALRKVAQPEDVAAQVVALASDTISGHVSGQVVVVAGGMEGRTIHPDQETA